MRKLISLLTAAALISSIFVVPVNADAAGEKVLWSDTFDGYTNTVIHQTSPERVGAVLVDGTAAARSTYTGIGGMVLTTSDKKDESSYYRVEPVSDGSTDMFLQTQVSQYSTRARGAYMQFNETYTAEEGKDIVLAFKLQEYNSGGTTYDDAFSVGNTIINMHKIGATLDEWHYVKLVVTTSGTSVYLDRNSKPVASSTDTSINKIAFNAYVDGEGTVNAQHSTENPIGYPTFCFNDMVVYETPDGVSSEVPAPETHEEATAAPTATPLPTAVPIENEVTVDFEGDNDFESVGVTTTHHKEYTVIEKTSDPVTSSNTVLCINQSSTKDTAYSYATFDMSALTERKSHVILEYDLYGVNNELAEDERLKVILQDGLLDGNKGSALPDGLFRQGKLDGTTVINFTLNTWVHTTVDMDFAAGTGTYKVEKANGVVIGAGNIETDIKELTTMSLVSWSTETVYLDNVVIKTGGVLEIPTASPEPASEIEGSYVDLTPVGATAISTFPPEAVPAQQVLNHSAARAAQESETVNAYSTKARTNSVYAAFDVLVNERNKLSVTAYNENSNKLGTIFTIEGKSDGTAAAGAIVDGGAAVKLEGNLVCGTWYRVIIEIPQNGESGGIETGNAVYTIYRINPDNPSLTSEIVVQNSELTPRNLAAASLTCFVFNAVGSPYIDNGVTYVAAQSASATTPEPTELVPATPEPESTKEGSYVDLVPTDANERLSDFAAAEGEGQKVLNHSAARAITESESINAYSTKARAHSIYTVFDVLVNSGDTLSVKAYNENSNKLGTTFIIEGKEDGNAAVSALVDKGDSIAIASGLVCGTWYRVVIEIPQGGADGATKTGYGIYTVYRIDPNDPTKTSSVAARSTELTPRNLINAALTNFVFEATAGAPYIDNGVTYLDEKSEYAGFPEDVLMTATDDGIEIYSKNRIESAELIGAVYTNDNQLFEVEILESISLEAGFTNITTEPVVPEDGYIRYFLIESFDTMQPLCETIKTK